LDPELARGLIDLREEEQVVDEEINARGRIFADRRRSFATGLVIAVAVPIAVAVGVAVAVLDGRRRRVGHVAVHRAITVVHGTDKDALAALFVAAASAASALALLLAVAVAAEEPLLARGLLRRRWLVLVLLSLRLLLLRLLILLRLIAGGL